MRPPCSDYCLRLTKELAMAYRPWYEKMADIDSANEREEFIRGVFGFRPREKQPIVAALIAGYIGGTIATRNQRK
jgi:hypothetical protein